MLIIEIYIRRYPFYTLIGLRSQLRRPAIDKCTYAYFRYCDFNDLTISRGSISSFDTFPTRSADPLWKFAAKLYNHLNLFSSLFILLYPNASLKLCRSIQVSIINFEQRKYLCSYPRSLCSYSLFSRGSARCYLFLLRYRT